MPIQLTPPMKRRLTRRAHDMIARSLHLFPELRGATITVGYTRKHLGSATVVYRKEKIARLIIRLHVRKVTYQTIGHELTHLVRGLAHGERARSRSADSAKVPSGEPQCDIWTLARDPLFCDDSADVYQTAARDPRALAGIRVSSARSLHRGDRKTPPTGRTFAGSKPSCAGSPGAAGEYSCRCQLVISL